ncbi:PA14 domain-containing protein [Hymenobacter weizhouensis]|uniref:PA14 domain-containing protein n=1 Tax=Hymenobacter sp. YIM 151500-1 TaxID=2987689 RepID=UPI002227BAF1|nr:PA14 domain-containing protein [Hymenobacter sp. YIM 151500-1]UYZ63631.1 PA14 domain-containing protein [Hymenobacter sp. YIM 151500-1]
MKANLLPAVAGRGPLLAALLALPLASAVRAQTPISFTLDKAYTTSAGVYRPDGTLVRTLWRKVPYTAGAHQASWDGRDDTGTAVAAGTYQVKVLTHNLRYVPEGHIGTTSDQQNKAAMHNAWFPPFSLALDGNTAYYVNGYTEGGNNLHRFDVRSPHTQTDVGRVDQFTAFGAVATDGTWLYLADYDGGYGDGANHTFVMALKASDYTEATFANGQELRLNGNQPSQHYRSVIDLDQTTGATTHPTGLAVQRTGNVLAVARGALNVVRLFDKRGGNLLGTITVPNPRGLATAPNGDLWVATGTSVVRYTNLAGGSPTVAATIGGLTNPLAVAVHPTNNDVVLVADGGSSQQVKAFTSTGTPLWTYGQAGGYQTNGPEVRTDKFWFDVSWGAKPGAALAVQADGSFWVGDGGNRRTLHFSANRTYLDQIAYGGVDYRATVVDLNNPTRVFLRLLEYQVDYSKPIGQSWTLVRNWGAGNLAAEYFGDLFGPELRAVRTLRNGRTYGFLRNKVVEFTGSQLRFTGLTVDGNNDWFSPEGNLHTASADRARWTTRRLTGFGNNNNPQWEAATALASASEGSRDPYPRCCSLVGIQSPVTSSGVLVSFDNSLNNGWHLGGVKTGGTDWLWKASPTVTSSVPLDGLGSYNIGDGVETGGNKVVASGRNIVFGYHGEFYNGGMANQFMHFYDDGLFVGQFGGADGVGGLLPELVQVNGETYLWVNDQTGRGPFRWHLQGANDIRELTGSGPLGSPITVGAPTALRTPENPTGTAAGLGYQYYQGQWTGLPDFSTLTPLATGTTSTPGLSVRQQDTNYALRFTGYVTVPQDGTYTFYTDSDDGSKLYIGSQLVVSNDGAHGPQELSGSIGLQAGTHALTVTYFQAGGGQTLSVSYQGPGVSKQTIPASALSWGPGSGGSTTGTGLQATYYNSPDLSGSAVLSRVDAQVNTDWGSGSPGTGVTADRFSVRWTGQVLAPVSGTYTFSTVSDDGVRLWVNGQQVINNWTTHPPTTDNAPGISLTAGQKADIKLEYFENTEGAVCRLQWAYPGQGTQAIPQSQLFPAAAGTPSSRLASRDAGAAPASLTAYPNPSPEGDATLVLTAARAQTATVQVRNAHGRLVRVFTVPVQAGPTEFRLPGALPRGTYFVQTRLDGQTRRLVLRVE